ncbi:MFS general substrate transporter [Massarina eburnea CBS 473.64]|uniref:MFS general substrate transporter n=1 Tax=Massarina eburnea CBS 473.64 TaxID=1395130 RepID=A0A6A6S6A2_9PLEO|nr:MFS general substrate transporter [Massarina eburnea CBS 473.64]
MEPRDSEASVGTTGTTGKDGIKYREDAEIERAEAHREGPGSSARHADTRQGDEESDERIHSPEPANSHTGAKRWWNVLGHQKRSHHTHYKVYKRRWFGLAQLVLLNIVVSWDWLTFAPVSTTAAEYFDVSESAINWLSTGFLFAFVVISPLVIFVIHRSPKDAIVWASVFLLIGNWIRYAGTKASGGIYGVVVFGQILTGFAQPFVLAAPTRFSDLWFTESGRVSATAVASLANPLGGALAQLINPLLGSVPDIVLYVAIIATVASVPSLFIPRSPPTPPSASSSAVRTPTIPSLRAILSSPPFYVVALTFSVYVGFFNAFSSLVNQILYPYGYTEDEAGICGAVLIVVGLVAAAIMSPMFDRTHAYLFGIKGLSILIAVAYLGMIWAPQTRGLVAPYVLSAIEGAASFSILPIALEYLVEITFPASPEVGSTVVWAGGQLFGGIFILIMDALKDQREVDLSKVRKMGRGQGGGDRPPGNMYNALVFQAVVSLVVLPFPLALGMKRLGLAHGEGRLALDERTIQSDEENGSVVGREM